MTGLAKDKPAGSRPTPLGIYDRHKSSGLTSVEIIAIALTVVWLAGAAVFFLTLPSEPLPGGLSSLRYAMVMMAIFLPVAMIWVAAMAAKATRVMREESNRMQASVDGIRQAYVAQSQGHSLTGEPSVTQKLDEIAAAARKTETTLATFASARHQDPAPSYARTTQAEPEPAEDQPALALGTTMQEMAPPLSAEDFIRALNFPETAEDEDGFTALRRALKDRSASQLIQAAQDVLTLLSQDGIYMDDLRPDRARPEIWRQFGQGARGKPVAALGGVHDRASLALAAGRMKQDPIFRDAAHHFLRKFDQIVSAFAAEATDGELSALADTRTARAFMLLGRVAGTFD